MLKHFLILPKIPQKGIINYAKITPTQPGNMATFRKRNNSWRAEVYKNDIRKSATFDTKSQAKACAAKVELNIDADNLKAPDENNKTVADAFGRYANEVSFDKKGARYEQIKLKAFSRDHLATIKLSELMPSDIAD